MIKIDETLSLKALKTFVETHKGKTAFPEHEVKNLLKEIGLPVPNGMFISQDMADRLPAALDIAYPAVAKVSSSKIVSKSEVKGVRAGIKNEDELKTAVAELLQIENAEGVLVEEMAPAGLEVIVGGVVDKQFGPVVMFGLGGMFVELLKDVSFALAPLKREDALRLIKQIKGYRLLEGFRGRPPVDINAAVDIVVIVSELAADGLIEEIDLNPVSLYPQGAMVLDAKLSVRRA